ncbi:MAG: hypothetical protein HYZ89_03505 [Candidatus Omnitrophica bacterium]|nr:hypothetical protein [Candidatus Omnitrophota bacterium]
MRLSQDIQCTICRKANSEFELITRRINEAGTPVEKAPHAKALIEKVDAVFKEHDTPGTLLTEACLTLLNLRKQTAELILKFKR